jgi:Family of unknown function (DUF6263)
MRCTMFSALRRGLLGLIVLAGPGGASAEAVTLRWKFKPGETLRYSIDQKSVTTAKLPGGQELKNALMQTLELSWSVKEVRDDGTAELVQTIERVVDKTDGPLGKFEYDSKSGQEPRGPIAATRVPLFKAMVGAPITFKINAQGEPSDVKVPERLTRSLREAGPAAAAAGQLFSEEGLKGLILQTSLVVPKEDLSEGRTWNRQTKETMPAVGTLVLDTTFTYQGTDTQNGRKVEKIGQVTKIDLQPPADAGNINFPLKVKSQDSRGVVHFDSDAGHLADSRMDETVELTASIMDMEVTQVTETSTVRKLVKDEVAK